MTALSTRLIASRNPVDVAQAAEDYDGEARWEQVIADEHEAKGRDIEAAVSRKRVAHLKSKARNLRAWLAKLEEAEKGAAE